MGFFGNMANARGGALQRRDQADAQVAEQAQRERQKMLELALQERGRIETNTRADKAQTLAERRAELEAARQAAADAAAARREDLENKRFKLQQDQFGETVRSNRARENKPVATSGTASDEPAKTTDGERKGAGFYMRAKDIAPLLDELEGEVAGMDLLSANSGLLGNKVQGKVAPNLQRFNQAANLFRSAVLRKDTGATINDQEMADTNRQFIPQRGDSPETLAQKRRARQVALEELRLGGGRANPADVTTTGATPAQLERAKRDPEYKQFLIETGKM